MECFARAYRAEQERLFIQKNQDYDQLSIELKALESKIDNLVEMIANGNMSLAISKALAACEETQLVLQEKIRNIPVTPKPITLSPDLHDIYMSRLNDLQKTLSHEGIRSIAAEVIQKLISRVEVTPRDSGAKGADLKVIGNIEQAIYLSQDP
ncbi:hypothetical protein O4H49_20520 [Kiloniella laminariae]|uniref:Resolvase/invertase-type recombinase catalytic domain-containing protein n=1 Tax=Kiloniella laminariae TaxID=454162 RepID=A0ABT4LPW4_9PROT|nr:hypothetical protein [Kiloniella laminariae]MCZ4283174.1 hypothetical protein [Kiloniella laminariae]